MDQGPTITLGEATTYFRAVAVDFDGTLADGEVAPDTLAAVNEVRRHGVQVILVTGRIMSELQAVFPEVDDHVDAVVAENGATVFTAAGVRELAAPVDPAVSASLLARGVTNRQGQVLVACAAADELAVLDVIRDLALDYRLVPNRGELMILPSGVTKGAGLREALADLGLSPHNTLGIGDAENDHSLFDVCELVVAVANAVDPLRRDADLVLSLPDGEGVADLLRGPVLSGRARIHSRRWQLTLGTEEAGDPVTIPASQLNIAVCGGTGDGKSYLTGLISEQLIRLGYTLIIADPEGDHVGLGALHDVLIVGGSDRHLAEPAEIVRLLPYATVVVDLSHMDAERRAGYAATFPGEVEAARAQTGIPQWVVLDEAHAPLGRHGRGLRAFNASRKGYLLTTWRPEELAADALASLDAVITLTSPEPGANAIDLTAAVADTSRERIAELLAGPTGRAVLAWRERGGQPTLFTLAARSTPHLRHEHKYDQSGVEPARQFYFRTESDTPTGATAANLAELEAELVICEPGVLRHHCPGRDFSRWIQDVFHDAQLATDIAAAEARLPPGSLGAPVERVRTALIAALQRRQVR